MNKYTVSLIFPVFNQPDMLLTALRSLKKTEAGIDYEVIIVDDGSTENMSKVYEKNKHLYDKIIHLDRSGNSTIAVNAGIKEAEGKYVQYQNSDVVFKQNYWLGKIVSAFESDSRIGTVGCKTLYEDNTVNHSMRRWISDGDQSNSHYERGLKLKVSSQGLHICPVVAGCGMTTTRKLWKQLGGLGVYQPYGWDDSDWCFRTWEAGYKVACQCDAWFYHLGSRSYRKVPQNSGYLDNRQIIEEKFQSTIQHLQKNYTIITFCSKNYLDAFEFCIDSWLKTKADKIVIYTDFDLSSPSEKIEVVQHFSSSTDWLENVGRKVDSVLHYLEHNSVDKLVFLDMDCYVTSDFSEVFENNFDIAATRFYSLRETISCGVWFANINKNSLQFIQDWSQKSEEYRKQGKGVEIHRAAYEQLAFHDLALELYKDATCDCIIFPLPEETYNCEHNKRDLWEEDVMVFRPKIIHLKTQTFRDEQYANKLIQLATGRNHYLFEIYWKKACRYTKNKFMRNFRRLKSLFTKESPN